MNNYDLMIERYRRELMNASKRGMPSEDEVKPVAVPIQANVTAQENPAPVTPTQLSESVPTTPTQPIEPAPVTPTQPIEPAPEAQTPMQQREPEPPEVERYTGTLRIEVYAADRAYAIPNARATITVTDDPDKKVVFSGLTDATGIIANIVLEAPSDSITAQPGILTGYASYDITVEHPRFRTQRFIGVPVFAGVESVQPVQMVPKNGKDDSMIIREREPSRLIKGKGEANA